MLGLVLCVTMDFIIGLPKLDSHGSIIMVVDKFSNLTDCTVMEMVRLFLKYVVTTYSNDYLVGLYR